MPGMTFSWTGLALEEQESAGKAILIFGLGLLVVYLTLSAQYESFALPFIILLAVPMAVLGALALVAARGISDDVYVQIGLVMLIGLSAKNSILIVEFAEQQLEHGKSIIEAAIIGGGAAAAADPDDQLCVHPGRAAALLRHGRGRAGPALGGHGGGWRHAGLDDSQPVLYPGAVCAAEDAARYRSRVRRWFPNCLPAKSYARHSTKVVGRIPPLFAQARLRWDGLCALHGAILVMLVNLLHRQN